MTSTTDRYMRGRTAIRATRLFDGTGTATAADPVIVISDGRISSVDVGPGAAVPPDAELVELPGATLLPGLVDTHVHLAFRRGPAVPTTPFGPEWARAGMSTLPRQLRPVVAVHGKHDGRHPPSPVFCFAQRARYQKRRMG
jgi:hypothetical protein